MSARIVNRKSEIANEEWLPDMDLNHDKVIQSHLCYHYTIGQAGALAKLDGFAGQSRLVKSLKRLMVESVAVPRAAFAVQRFNRSTNHVFQN